MAVKDFKITNVSTGAVWISGSCDYATFGPNWFVTYDEATDTRVGYSWAYTTIQKVVVSPSGVAYPGDTSPGTGAKKVTIDFAGTPPNVVMTLVDDVILENGWLEIIKGDHVIAYQPTNVLSVVVAPG